MNDTNFNNPTEKRIVETIEASIGRSVRISPTVFDAESFTPRKFVMIEMDKGLGNWKKLHAGLCLELAQDDEALGKEEKIVSTFIEDCIAESKRLLAGKRKVYLAGGWFNPAQAEELAHLEKMFDDRADWIELASPRRIFVCPPDAPKEVQDNTFTGNLHHIETADFLLVNTRDKDIGTIWEAGYAFAHKKPIVYFCNGLPAGAKFNLMLARSGIKVCTSFEQLEDYLGRVKEKGELIVEPYSDDIE